MRKPWTIDMILATRALYEMVGTKPPGEDKNVLVGILADEFGVSRSSIRMRLFNFENRNLKTSKIGLSGGGGKKTWMQPIAYMRPAMFARYIKDLRKRRPNLKNVI